MKRCAVMILLLTTMLFTVAFSEEISDILPSDELWGISRTQLMDRKKEDYEDCVVGNAMGLLCKNINIEFYDFEAFYIFSEDMGKHWGLSKIAYIMTDKAILESSDLKDCVETITRSLKATIGMPESETKAVTTWNMGSYTIQVGAGRFKNYIGTDDKTVGIIFKHTAPSEQHVEPIALQTMNLDHFSCSVPNGWKFTKERNYCYVNSSNNAGYIITESVLPDKFLQYSEDVIKYSLKKEMLEYNSEEINFVEVMEVNFNNLPGIIFKLQSGIVNGYIYLTFNDKYGIMCQYLETSSNNEKIYNTATQLFKTVKVRNADYIIPSTTQKPYEDKPETYSYDENSQFSGAMVTVNVAGINVQIHKSFKDLMDSYEAYFNDYIDAMSSGNYLRILEAMTDYVDMLEALEDLDEADMTENEAAYYIEVYARIMQRLALVDY